MIELHREGPVFVLRLDDGENRFRHDSLAAWNETLDQVEAAPGPKALVTTGTGKFYSNGLDLEWAMSEAPDFGAYLEAVLALFGRVLSLPCHTVAAMNGHAFGAGGQIALAHDFRVMRADRGYFCMPEVDMQAPLHPGMLAILKARLPRQTFHEVITTAKRYGGAEALAAGIVEHASPESDVLPKAVEIASALAPKAHEIVARMRRDAYPDVFGALKASMALPGQ